MKFSFNRVNLYDLLTKPLDENDNWLVVPPFQRKYVWRKNDEVADLLTDFFGNLDGRFFGEITLKMPQRNAVEVIDGQQRLTTFTMIVVALIDQIAANSANWCPNNEQKTLNRIALDLERLVFKDSLHRRKPALVLADSLKNDFAKRILSEGNPPLVPDKIKGLKKSTGKFFKPIASAYLAVYDAVGEEIEGTPVAKRMAFIERVHSALINKVYFAQISVSEYADAYEYFESVNARGRGLTVPELVKNLSFRKLANEERMDSLQERWDDMEGRVSNFPNFIYHYWASAEETCPKSKIYRHISQTLDKRSIEEVDDFLSALDAASEHYAFYETPSSDQGDYGTDNEAFAHRYATLRGLKAERCYPLLLSLDHSRDVFMPQEHLDFLQAIISLTFWYSGIYQKDAKRLESEYHSMARDIRKGGNLPAHLPRLDKFFEIRDYRDDFINGIPPLGIIRNIILREIEDNMREDKSLKISRSNKTVHLEHILPQTRKSDSEWVNIFLQNAEIEQDKIGNLTLLYHAFNESVKNGTFASKIKEYRKSDLKLNEEIVTKFDDGTWPVWNVDAIKSRGELLFDRVKKIWPIPPDKIRED